MNAILVCLFLYVFPPYKYPFTIIHFLTQLLIKLSKLSFIFTHNLKIPHLFFHTNTIANEPNEERKAILKRLRIKQEAEVIG